MTTDPSNSPVQKMLDVPCPCDEKPRPHYRHRDGTGPGSGRELDPGNDRQAHWSRK